MNTNSATSFSNVVPVSEIMTRDVVSVHVDDPVELVRALFAERGISGAPVLDDCDQLCGVVSKTDLVRDSWIEEDASTGELSRAERAQFGEGFHVLYGARASVRDVMTPFALCVVPETSIARVAALMVYEGVHRVFVSDPDGTIHGVVSVLDLARFTAREAGFLVPGERRATVMSG